MGNAVLGHDDARIGEDAHGPEQVIERCAEAEMGVDELQFLGREGRAGREQDNWQLGHYALDFPGKTGPVHHGHFIVKKGKIEAGSAAESESFGWVVAGDDAKATFF